MSENLKDGSLNKKIEIIFSLGDFKFKSTVQCVDDSVIQKGGDSISDTSSFSGNSVPDSVGFDVGDSDIGLGSKELDTKDVVDGDVYFLPSNSVFIREVNGDEGSFDLKYTKDKDFCTSSCVCYYNNYEGNEANLNYCEKINNFQFNLNGDVFDPPVFFSDQGALLKVFNGNNKDFLCNKLDIELDVIADNLYVSCIS